MSRPLKHPSMHSTYRSILSVLFLTIAVAARGGDVKLEARLVWGTSDDKTDARCKPMEPELSNKLHGMFKWKNYYEITNQLPALR
jgi:hypothetical protein